MLVIGINSSPRENGNTRGFLEIALNRAKELGADTEYIWLGDKNLKGCRGCYGCVQAKECVVKDDFQAIFDEMVKADVIFLASPTYHASINAEMKALLDRVGFSGRWAAQKMKDTNESYDWGLGLFADKVIAPITVARRTGQVMAFSELLVWAAANDCIIIGNSYWNMGVAGKGGATNFEEDAEGVGIMKGLAERAVRPAQKINA